MRQPFLLATILLFLVACGGSSSSKNERAGTIPTSTAQAPTATTLPTSTPAAAGHATTTASEPTPTATIAPTPTVAKGLPTTDQLRVALLTLDDMPTGWTTMTGSDDNSTTDICGVPDSSNVQQVKVSADFQKSQLGPFLTDTIGAFKHGGAQTWMDAFKRRASCTQFTDTDSQGTPTTYQLAPLSFPKMGDDTFAFRLTTDAGIATIEADLVYIRWGDYIVQIGNASISSVDSDLTSSIAQKALDKLTKTHP